MSTPGEVFLGQCRDQQVELAPPIDIAMNRLWVRDHHTLGYKTPVMYGIAAAGVELDARPRDELSSGQLDTGALKLTRHLWCWLDC